MGVATWDPENGWEGPDSSGEFNRNSGNSGYERGGPEMGYKQPTQRPELDPRDFPQTDLQIIPVTPTREEEERHRWNPAWKIEDVIKNGNTPPPKKTPFVN